MTRNGTFRIRAVYSGVFPVYDSTERRFVVHRGAAVYDSNDAVVFDVGWEALVDVRMSTASYAIRGADGSTKYYSQYVGALANASEIGECHLLVGGQKVVIDVGEVLVSQFCANGLFYVTDAIENRRNFWQFGLFAIQGTQERIFLPFQMNTDSHAQTFAPWRNETDGKLFFLRANDSAGDVAAGNVVAFEEDSRETQYFKMDNGKVLYVTAFGKQGETEHSFGNKEVRIRGF